MQNVSTHKKDVRVLIISGDSTGEVEFRQLNNISHTHTYIHTYIHTTNK